MQWVNARAYICEHSLYQYMIVVAHLTTQSEPKHSIAKRNENGRRERKNRQHLFGIRVYAKEVRVTCVLPF